MTKGAWIMAIVFAVIYAVLIGLCIHMDMSMWEAAPVVRVEYRNEPAPYPEEDTMHYITKEGVLIIYGSGTEGSD